MTTVRDGVLGGTMTNQSHCVAYKNCVFAKKGTPKKLHSQKKLEMKVTGHKAMHQYAELYFDADRIVTISQ